MLSLESFSCLTLGVEENVDCFGVDVYRFWLLKFQQSKKFCQDFGPLLCRGGPPPAPQHVIAIEPHLSRGAHRQDKQSKGSLNGPLSFIPVQATSCSYPGSIDHPVTFRTGVRSARLRSGNSEAPTRHRRPSQCRPQEDHICSRYKS